MPSRHPSKAATHKIGGYNLISKFPGYNARQDQTTLPPGTLVTPSQNVLIKTSGRVATVNGYTLDGTGSTVVDSGILSNFDFSTFKGDVRNLRAGFLTTAANDGKLQYRYKTSDGVIHWVDLATALTNVRLAYCEYWDTSALVKDVLWVDGTSNISAWNGAVTTVASATATTVTKQGTTTWAQEGFSTTGSIVIGGVAATYSGGTSTTTLTGVSVDFSATAAGTIAHQQTITTALGSMTGILATFIPTVIGCGRNNQVYVGSSSSNSLYISKVNDYTNYAFTTPVRVVGEGDLIPLDAPPSAFMPLENRSDENSYDVYISEGDDRWAVIRSTLSADLTSEKLEHIRVKVAPLQGAQSTRLVSKMKNHIMYVGHDNVANFLGYLSFQYVPELVDFSWPIIDDMSNYDFTDASIFYHRNYVYIAIPKENLVRVFNMTNQTQQQTSSIRGVEDVDPDQPWFWEAPLTLPLSGFYVVDGELYGHSYTTSESYRLFTGDNFNGQNITAIAAFSYNDYGDRTTSKGSTELWVEGYVKQNTTIQCTVVGDLDSFATNQTSTIAGDDNTIVAYGSGAHALGKNPLGSQPLGGAATVLSNLPAWFHVSKTYPEVSSYLEQIIFQSEGVDLHWELIVFGTDAQPTPEGNNFITQ